MSEVLNENPVVLEEWQLPSRKPINANDEKIADLHNLEEVSLFAPSLEALPELDYTSDESEDTSDVEPVDPQEIYDLISTLSDPEHPLTLGQLSVVSLDRIHVDDTGNSDDIGEVHVEITPTITHCSLATLIGLGLRVRLERSLPPRFRVKITVTPGSHQSEVQVNKQLNDKERVAAACENDQLLGVIGQMLSTCK